MADELLTMTIIEINPFQRWNLSTGKVLHSNMWHKGYKHKQPHTASWALEDKLRKCGFLFKHNNVYKWLTTHYPYYIGEYDFELTKQKEDQLVIAVIQKSDNCVTHYLTLDSQEEWVEFCNIVGKEIT